MHSLSQEQEPKFERGVVLDRDVGLVEEEVSEESTWLMSRLRARPFSPRASTSAFEIP